MTKTKNKAQEVAGKVKEKTGEVTGDHDLQARGKADQAKPRTTERHLAIVSGALNQLR